MSKIKVCKDIKYLFFLRLIFYFVSVDNAFCRSKKTERGIDVHYPSCCGKQNGGTGTSPKKNNLNRANENQISFKNKFTTFAKKISMFKHWVILLFIISILMPLNAQEMNVKFDIETGIEEVEEAHLEAWQKVGKVEGYRIQLIAVAGTNSKKNAQKVLDEFSLLFPEIAVYLSYSEPNFRVRAGNFRTRLDALRVLGSIRQLYPGAFIVKDKIFYTEL